MTDIPSWMQEQTPAPPEPNGEAPPPEPQPPEQATVEQAYGPALVTNATPERLELLERINVVSSDPGAFKALIYGPKGVGKTVFCCRARNCILIAAEPGQRSLLNHPELRRVPVLPVRSFNDLDEIAWAKREGDLDRWAKAKFGIERIETFVIDTVSEMSNRTASELLDKAWAQDQRRNRFMVSQAEYRVRNELFRRLTADYVDLGINFILTAHETEFKDEAEGRMYLRPDLSDAMAGSLGGLVDLQARLTVEVSEEGRVTRYLQVHPTRRVDAKTRIGGLPILIQEPNIQGLIDAGRVADESRVPEGATV